MKPAAASGSASLLDTMAVMISSGTSCPLSLNSCATADPSAGAQRAVGGGPEFPRTWTCRPKSEPSLISARTRSPVEIVGTPNTGARRVAKVPLPTPGAPRKTMFTGAACVATPRRPQAACFAGTTPPRTRTAALNPAIVRCAARVRRTMRCWTLRCCATVCASSQAPIRSSPSTSNATATHSCARAAGKMRQECMVRQPIAQLPPCARRSRSAATTQTCLAHTVPPLRSRALVAVRSERS